MNELELVTITLDGHPVDFHGVLADLTIRHGRTGYFDAPQPATATLTFLEVTKAFTRPFRLGQRLVINASDGSTTAPRFTGQLTDASLDVDVLTATGVGTLRTLSGFTVGAADYPAERWSARLARIFAEVSLSSTLALEAGLFDPMLVARAAEPVALASYLADLAAMVDAAVADLPDGRVLVQAIDARKLENLYDLDPAEVAYAPQWHLQLPEANIVTVTYGDPSTSLTKRDQLSIDLYGPISVSIETAVADVADADAIASTRLVRNAYAHWTIDDAPLLAGRRFAIGTPLELSLLPPAAPYDPWTPILEGWADHVSSDGEELDWMMELALSDPLRSGLTLPWIAVPLEPAYHWNTIDQTTAWRDALTLDTL